MSRVAAFRVSSNLLFLAAAAYGLAALLSQLVRERLEPEPMTINVTGSRSRSSPVESLQAAPLARMFGFTPQSEETREPPQPTTPPSPFQVLATMVATPPGFSMALVSSLTERKTMLVEIGTELGGQRVVRIERDPSVVVLRDLRTGEESSLFTGTPPPTSLASVQPVVSSLGIERGPSGEVTVPVALLESHLADLGKLASQVRVVPATRGGQGMGVTFRHLQEGSPLAQLGLQAGDTLTSVNGIELRSPDQWMEAYSKLRSSSDFVLSLERGGKPAQLRVRVR
jgi:general secretion pathway protein C